MVRENESSATHKRCRTCWQAKPPGEFNRHTGYKDGFTTQCKDCEREYKREYRKMRYETDWQFRVRMARGSERYRKKMWNNEEWRARLREQRREYMRRYRAQKRLEKQQLVSH